MALPLDSYQGFAKLGYEFNDKLWAVARLNKGNSNDKYDFNGNEFDLTAFTMAGFVDDNGNHWLICAMGLDATDAKKGVFEFKVWKNGEDGAKGSFDKVTGESLVKRFQGDGSLAAINVDNIASLKALVAVLHEVGIVVAPAVDSKIKAHVSLPEGQYEALIDAYTLLFGYFIESKNEAPEEGTEGDRALDLISGLNAVVLPVLDVASIPGTDIKDKMGKVKGRTTYIFPYEGDMPFARAVFTPPVVETKKSGGGGKSFGSGGSYDPLKNLNARRDFVLQEFKAVNAELTTLEKVWESCRKADDNLTYFEFIVKIMGK